MASSNKRSTSAEWGAGGSGSDEGPKGKKRVRFGGERPAMEDLELDDSDLLEQRKTRRGAVTVVEYKDGEVSSDDEEDERKKKLPLEDEAEDEVIPGLNDGEEEEADMFADPEEIARKEESKKKKLAFLQKKKGKGKTKGFDRSEIEGEDLDEAELDEDDYDEEGNLKIEAFNMKGELEEGGEIDENGNFVSKLDPERFHDSWLEGLSRKEIESARRAHERKERKALMEEKEAAQNAMTETDIYVEIVNTLKPGESVVGGKKGGPKGAKAVKKKSWQKNKSTAMDTDTTAPTAVAAGEPAESEDDAKRRLTIEKLTDLCDKMMAMGHFDVYEETYEQMVRKLRRADIIEDDWEVGTPVLKPGERLAALLAVGEESTPVQWEYKWANPQEGQDADQVFGPFSGADMKSWSQQGFFSNGILVRMVGDSTFDPATDATFE
ncbi:hypothetical protein BGW39_005583 [Mortierella sp. 14UC]|nr:hypothetical protein BGW39_005583 [Mortierella sp. 14UC]